MRWWGAQIGAWGFLIVNCAAWDCGLGGGHDGLIRIQKWRCLGPGLGYGNSFCVFIGMEHPFLVGCDGLISLALA